MKTRFLTLIVGTCIFSSVALAQCDLLVISKKEHTWTKIPDSQPGLVKPANLSKEEQLGKTLFGFVSALYPKPKGGEGKWYISFGGKNVDGQYPDAYTVHFNFYNYLCANGVEKLSSGYVSAVFVFVNHMGDMARHIKINNKDFVAVLANTQQSAGYNYYLFDPNDLTRVDEQWTFTYKDKVPFIYMTRKEYLTEIREENARTYDKMVKENPSPQVKAIYGRVLGVIDDLLKNKDEKYLSQPAIINASGSSSNFEGFEKNYRSLEMSYIVRNNPEYFNKNLPASSPQYISVLFRHPTKGETDLQYYNALNQKAFLDNLAGLPGK